jgi:hypothetical protein
MRDDDMTVLCFLRINDGNQIVHQIASPPNAAGHVTFPDTLYLWQVAPKVGMGRIKRHVFNRLLKDGWISCRQTKQDGLRLDLYQLSDAASAKFGHDVEWQRALFLCRGPMTKAA